MRREMKLLLKLSDVIEGDGIVMGDTVAGGGTNAAHMVVDHVEEVVSTP